MIRFCISCLLFILAAGPALAADSCLTVKPYPDCATVLKKDGALGPACRQALGRDYPRLVCFLAGRVPGGERMLMDCGQSAKDWIFLSLPKNKAPALQRLCLPRSVQPDQPVKQLTEQQDQNTNKPMRPLPPPP